MGFTFSIKHNKSYRKYRNKQPFIQDFTNRLVRFVRYWYGTIRARVFVLHRYICYENSVVDIIFWAQSHCLLFVSSNYVNKSGYQEPQRR